MTDPHEEFKTSLASRLSAIFADMSSEATPDSKAAEISDALSQELKKLLAGSSK